MPTWMRKRPSGLAAGALAAAGAATTVGLTSVLRDQALVRGRGAADSVACGRTGSIDAVVSGAGGGGADVCADADDGEEEDVPPNSPAKAFPRLHPLLDCAGAGLCADP
jgi:hypothetical protein